MTFIFSGELGRDSDKGQSPVSSHVPPLFTTFPHCMTKNGNFREYMYICITIYIYDKMS